MEPSDAAILDLFHRFDGSGRDKAFAQLVRKYREPLYYHIRRIVTDHHYADDVAQNTLMKVWRALPNFRADAMLYTWLYKIATNEALQFLRKNSHKSGEELDETVFKEKLIADPYFNGDEAQLKLQTAIATLPEKQKLVFIMKYYDDLNYYQISDILDTSVGALKASYHHAVKKIEEKLKAD